MGRVRAVDDVVVGRSGGVDALHGVLSVVPSGRRPSVSTVKPTATGSPVSRTARTKPIASPAPVSVSAVTSSAPAAAADRAWAEWYAAASSGSASSPATYPSPRGPCSAADLDVGETELAWYFSRSPWSSSIAARFTRSSAAAS